MNRIKAIDVHGHYGVAARKDLTPLHRHFMTGSAEVVAARAREADIDITVVSPLLGLFPRGEADAVAGNEEAARIIPGVEGLRQWVIVNPLQPETYRQASRLLQEPTCVGIKIHPEEHRYPIKQYGHELFKFAAENRAVMLTHTGEGNSLPGDFVPFANEFPETRLILAHLGNGETQADLQVRAIQRSTCDNVFVDTSSAQSILPGLIEWAVKEIGADKILFGTDTPLYFTAMQRARIDFSDLTIQQKKMIFRDNAIKIFKGKIQVET